MLKLIKSLKIYLFNNSSIYILKKFIRDIEGNKIEKD